MKKRFAPSGIEIDKRIYFPRREEGFCHSRSPQTANRNRPDGMR